MSKWILKGLATGVKTTRFPGRPEEAAGVTPGLPAASVRMPSPSAAEAAALSCPTGALQAAGKCLTTDPRRCIHCLRCASGPGAVPWVGGYDWARRTVLGRTTSFDGAFARSLHVRVVDAGACDACLSEIKQLNKPYYNMHRLGFFLTPTPRHADVLLVAGPVTHHMRMPLLKAYEAMPTPRRVLAVGNGSLTGCLFGPSFASAGGVGDVLPVDVEVPGCPPPPLAILHGLLLLAGRTDEAGDAREALKEAAP
jgi:Ni,Fe-hydrogenase III small subunit